MVEEGHRSFTSVKVPIQKVNNTLQVKVPREKNLLKSKYTNIIDVLEVPEVKYF